MTDALLLDVLLVLALVLYAAGMWRAGIVAGALAIAGLLGGGLLALWGLPLVLDRWQPAAGDPTVRVLVVIIGSFISAVVGQQLGTALGARWRSRLSSRPARLVDSLLGAVGAVVVGAGLVWLGAGAVVGSLQSTPRAVADSRVLQGIDGVMPASAEQVISGAYRSLDSGFPRVFAGVQPERIRPVEAPEPGTTRGRGIAAAGQSVVKVMGGACGGTQTGSGWVVADQRIVTNAHVVAGVDHPVVQVGGTGRTHAATTVAFDPLRDVAVLAVPDLTAPALPTGDRQAHGDDVVVAGFPLGGPYDLEAGRVRDVLQARGAGIDGTLGVTRDIYSINARVQQGNSGGPLLSPTGQVVGTVFAKSPSDETTGYVLTLEETRPVVEDGLRASAEVGTGECVR
ncbi:MarP family serine protease [Janibacter sp. G349]|uniref:MarP family serine protease n=1 Tax=Janibacter sp. G349 TaxID=3405424 RepID=UPI003B7766BC